MNFEPVEENNKTTMGGNQSNELQRCKSDLEAIRKRIQELETMRNQALEHEFQGCF